MADMGQIHRDTLPGFLFDTAGTAPDRGIGYIRDGASPDFQTYPALVNDACRIRCGLQRAGVKPGEITLLAVSSAREFVPAFWACILGGIVPAPVPASASFTAMNPALERIANVCRVLKSPPVICSGPGAENALGQGGIAGGRILTLEALADNAPCEDFHPAAPEDLAFVQFSSGSTGRPRGVCLTHENIVANLRAIEAGLALSREDRTLSWMPLYHDMGLIGFHLVPLHAGIGQVLMDTRLFAGNPLAWLDSLEENRPTITAAPGFCQAMVLKCLAREKKASWDLSSVRLVLNGAEPISPDLMSAFCRRMAAFSLNPGAMLPVYGLAEATLAVTFPETGILPRIDRLKRHIFQGQGRAVPAGEDDPSPVTFVSVGKPLNDCELRIVDNEDLPLDEGRTGHVQVRGKSVTQGYVNNPGETERAFCGPWLRTGDLGYLRDGLLFVTGRAKDVIFVNGRNLYAEDLERIAWETTGAGPGKIAVCGSFDPEAGRDRVLIFFRGEVSEKLANLLLKAGQALQERAGAPIDAFVPVESAPFPRTSSGKLQRYKLVRQYEKGGFDEAVARFRSLCEEGKDQGPAPPRTTSEILIHRIWCQELVLPPEAVGIHDHFADLGGSSLNAAAIIARLEKRYHIRLTSENLAEYPTIAAVSAYLDKHPRMEAGTGKGVFRG